MESLNEELIEINETSDEKIETQKTTSNEKNTKKDIVDKIFRLTEEYNIECCHTEKQFLRWSRKRLLKFLADTIEETCRLKIQGEILNLPPETVDFAANLPMITLVHGFFSSLLEKGFNASANYLEYSYELRDYTKTINKNPLLPPILLEISTDLGPELLTYLSNPYLKLLFVHCTCMFSCCVNTKETMVSPRLDMSFLNKNK